MTKLLNPDIAIERILQHVPPAKTERIATGEGLGRILAEPLTAPIYLPPFDRSSMDGFAVRAEDVQQTGVVLTLVDDIPAGKQSTIHIARGQAARIMTGAAIPEGADTVVPVEDTDVQWEPEEPLPSSATVRINKPNRHGANIRARGENVSMGQEILPAHHEIRPQDMGIIAGLGIANISVYKQPRVTVLTTGDELLQLGEPLSDGKIYDMNSYTINGLVRQHGGVPIQLPPSADTIAAVRGLFQEALLQTPDVIVSTAGVSVGTFDVVRTVLAELGSISFWRVNVRPGKPLAFGLINDIPFFGLPGNPVSAMVTFDVFVRPVLYKLSQRTDDSQYTTAITGHRMTSDGRRTYVRVQLEKRDGQIIAHETGTQSSGALLSMVKADALMIIPEGTSVVEAGTPLKIRLLSNVIF